MKRKFSIVSSLFVLSIFIYLLFQSASFSPLYFISSLFSFPRAYVYSIVYADKSSDAATQLKKENTKLREKMQDYDSLKKDNVALRSQFEETTMSSSSLVPAKIVGLKGNPQNPTNFILDQGERSGIRNNAPVIVGKQLVGRITKVNPYFSEVVLVINKDFSTIAQTQENNSPGIIKGYDEFILFEHVVITDVISKNESVISKGELDSNGVGIPPGLIIGKITKVNKSETQPFQSATIESLLDFNKLSTVFILKQ